MKSRRNDGTTGRGGGGRTARRPVVPSASRPVVPSARPSAGVTLIELLVVLVILGGISGAGLLALPALRPTPEGVELQRSRLARAEAIRNGQEIEMTIDSTRVRFLPDGRVIGGAFDPLTGAWRHAR